jgi:hypothetical protein
MRTSAQHGGFTLFGVLMPSSPREAHSTPGIGSGTGDFTSFWPCHKHMFQEVEHVLG